MSRDSRIHAHKPCESIRLLRANPDLRQRLGLAAHREAFQLHGWERRVRLVLEIVSAASPASGRPEVVPENQPVNAYAN